eukprot:CAMPEP_0184704280 /NCGR_PEP_ID=MMETSP0313-20130426/30689_1 /TAXON_ID=2792 /ORGANISM="Porphyridium aerugineum, Strain SAG 1380-2" /LENGTH=49 /DNA_ID= /DNA_START= /DNA_END= /DNA_ORIENTATION=
MSQDQGFTNSVMQSSSPKTRTTARKMHKTTGQRHTPLIMATAIPQQPPQ